MKASKMHFIFFITLTSFIPHHLQAQKGSFIKMKGSSGAEYRAFVAGPEDAKSAVLFVHDYFGISPAARQAVERIASFGYRVVGVDLYKGKSATEHSSAVALMQAVDKSETIAILQTAIDYLKRPGRKIASVGFSAGCVDAMNANLLAPELFGGTVLVYGGGYDQITKEKLDKLASPVLAITGALDKWPMDAAMKFMADQKDKQFDLYIKAGADHGFDQPLFNGGKNYDYEAARITWLLINDFLKHNLD
jgi:carboxymethylenebutenolidase